MCAFEPTKEIENTDLAQLLASRGFDRETVPALVMFPLVHVAWADGKLEQQEAEAIGSIAQSSGFLNEASAKLLSGWITTRPDESVTEANLELVSILLAAIADDLPVSIDDVEALAKAVGKAAGGVFGLFFRLNADEKKALAEIQGKLGVSYGDAWRKTLAGLRDDWRITDWQDFGEPAPLSGADADNPLLFTDSRAIEGYEKGDFRGVDGRPLTRDDLIGDVRADVMRTEPWKAFELKFGGLLRDWSAKGLIGDAGVYWNNSPHATVYQVNANLRFTLEGRQHRIKKGEQLVFMCQMAREMNDLTSPFATGRFAATQDSMLCGEMSNAMMGAGMSGMGDLSGGMGGMGGDMKGGGMKMGPPPDVDLAAVTVDESQRVAYLVLDLSGSMKGEKLRMAKMAVMSFLERLPTAASLQVTLRPFATKPMPLLCPLGTPYTMQTRMGLMGATRGLQLESSTALFQTVNVALDDVLRLVDTNRNVAPKTYLIVLSDGEDNQGVKARFGGLQGEEAVFARMRDYRERGLIEYLPIAYGGRAAVRHLEQIGGEGFRVAVTSPEQIIARFGEIRRKLMVGMPMNNVGGMGNMAGMGGMKPGGMKM